MSGKAFNMPGKRTWRHEVYATFRSLYQGDVGFYRVVGREVRRHRALQPAISPLVFGVIGARLVVVLWVAAK